MLERPPILMEQIKHHEEREVCFVFLFHFVLFLLCFHCYGMVFGFCFILDLVSSFCCFVIIVFVFEFSLAFVLLF